jgi:hypothetical protein
MHARLCSEADYVKPRLSCAEYLKSRAATGGYMIHLHHGHNGRPKKLPKLINDYMRYRFGVLPEYLENLRCFEFEGVVNDKKVTRYRIYSPMKAQQQKIIIAELPDLEKYPGMLLYEGYVDKEGKAYVADRRIPLRTK